MNAPGYWAMTATRPRPVKRRAGIRTQHGTLTLDANGSFTYSPEPNFDGGDSFTYRASDGNRDLGSGQGDPDGHSAQRPPQ